MREDHVGDRMVAQLVVERCLGLVKASPAGRVCDPILGGALCASD